MDKRRIRFHLKNNNNSTVELVDREDELTLSHQFNKSDEEWLNQLLNFLNNQNRLLLKVIHDYDDSIIELNDFKAKIIHTIQEEINDCERLYNVDKTDDYTQGRLIELHNIIKVLL